MSYPDIGPRLKSPSKALGVAPPSVLIASSYISIRYMSRKTYRRPGGKNRPEQPEKPSSLLLIPYFLFFQNSHRNKVAPTVNPAPTLASSTRSPFFIRFSSSA